MALGDRSFSKLVWADVPGGEAVIGDQCRPFCIGHRDVGGFKRFSVQRSEVAAHRRRRPFA
jgi:hypothetical protein